MKSLVLAPLIIGLAATGCSSALDRSTWGKSAPQAVGGGRIRLLTAFAFPAPPPSSRQDDTDKGLTAAPKATQLVAATAAAAAAALFWSAAATPAAADADIASGAALFKAECAGCHMGGQNFMSEKKTLKKEALEQFQSLDATKLQIFVQSQMPHSFLPFHSKWSDQDFGDVIGYVLDQAINDKWE